MICQTCHNNGVVPINRDGRRIGVEVCPTCQGSGRDHCCEGDCVQPELDKIYDEH